MYNPKNLKNFWGAAIRVRILTRGIALYGLQLTLKQLVSEEKWPELEDNIRNHTFAGMSAIKIHNWLYENGYLDDTWGDFHAAPL